MKAITILFLLAPFQLFSQANINTKPILQNSYNKSESSVLPDYSVSHFGIYVDTVAYGVHEIVAHTEVTVIASQASFSTIQLDLLKFNIDSIVAPGYSINHTYNDTVIDIQISPLVTFNDSIKLTVYYHGMPSQDASGWGGFYFSGTNAFNLGVGFAADPHNYGRAWFPCIDNFTSRSSYDFYITTQAGYKAFCNGMLQSMITNPGGSLTWHWKMNQTIPSYLASMLVAPNISFQRTSNGLPVEWACTPSDTLNILNTFSTLDTALATFINAYGPYPFDKVGYCLVPFNSGAMEHATSIHIGRGFINGSQTYATLWAHELSHMWWGDKVTCETAEDMWLNEGFASFNEALYTQAVLGEPAYRNWIRTNHRKVLQFAHTSTQDGSYLTMNNIPHEYTYGMHVYQKGADLVHTMRYYMGDSAFFTGCKAYMNNKAYNSATSFDLRDELTNSSGINMNRFFDDWILTPGFPHFAIDSVVHVPGGLDHMYVYTRQKTKGNNHLYAMPVEVNFTDGVNDTTFTVTIDSVTNMFHMAIYFAPLWTTLDRREHVSDAIASNEKTIISTGINPFPETNVTLNVQTLDTGTTIVRVDHDFVAPDPFLFSNPGIKVSDYHYWTIEGIFPPAFLTKATFLYNGTASGTAGFLDNTLIAGTEDSVVMLYRKGAGYNWEIVNSYTLNTGANVNDKAGSIQVDTLLMGEYCIGYLDHTVGMNEINNSIESSFSISPNPSNEKFTIIFSKPSKQLQKIIIFDMGGRSVFQTEINSGQEKYIWDARKFNSGIYNVVLFEKGKRVEAKKVILTKE